MEIVEAAIALGLPVFPVAQTKRPVCPRGFKDAEREPGRIRALWWRWPAPMIGVPTGNVSGLAVIDIDPQGIAWLDRMLRARRLPQTRVHCTRRGGFHFLYEMPAAELHNSAGLVSFGVDIRGEGGYVVYPPSPGYEVVDDSPPAPFPKFILRRLERERGKRARRWETESGAGGGDNAALVRFVERSRPGERNCRLFWAAMRLVEAGADCRVLGAAAAAAGLDGSEIEATLKSAARHRP